MALDHARGDIPRARFARLRKALDANADRLLMTERTGTNTATGPAGSAMAKLEEKLRNRLTRQREHLFTFLDHDGVDATNNLAERQLRPAVISRKLSCGNKTPRGAETWQILISLAITCTQPDRTRLPRRRNPKNHHPTPITLNTYTPLEPRGHDWQ